MLEDQAADLKDRVQAELEQDPGHYFEDGGLKIPRGVWFVTVRRA
jgi:hypothetical protein